MFSSSLTQAESRGKWERDKGGVNFGEEKRNDTKVNPGQFVPLSKAESARREAKCTGQGAVDLGAQAGWEMSRHMNRGQVPSQAYLPKLHAPSLTLSHPFPNPPSPPCSSHLQAFGPNGPWAVPSSLLCCSNGSLTNTMLDLVVPFGVLVTLHSRGSLSPYRGPAE